MNELEKAIEDCERAFKGLTALNAAAYMLGRIKSLRLCSASPPEGRQDGGYAAIRQIVFDALDLSKGLRDDCTADVMNALTKAGALTHSTPVAYASAEQLAFEDHPGNDEGGVYIPLRKTPAGKFTTPLFAAQPLPKQGTGEGQ